MDAFLHFFIEHNVRIIESLVVLILLGLTWLVVRAFMREDPADSETSEGSSSVQNIDLSGIEKKLEALVTAKAAAAGSSKGLFESMSEDAVPAALPADQQALQLEIEELRLSLEQRDAELTTLKENLQSAARQEASGEVTTESQVQAASGEVDELRTKLAQLEERLAEYEIIEQDIADLSFYKEENEKLKAQIEALSKAAPASATSEQEPSAAAPAEETSGQAMEEISAAAGESESAASGEAEDAIVSQMKEKIQEAEGEVAEESADLQVKSVEAELVESSGTESVSSEEQSDLETSEEENSAQEAVPQEAEPEAKDEVPAGSDYIKKEAATEAEPSETSSPEAEASSAPAASAGSNQESAASAQEESVETETVAGVLEATESVTAEPTPSEAGETAPPSVLSAGTDMDKVIEEALNIDIPEGEVESNVLDDEMDPEKIAKEAAELQEKLPKAKQPDEALMGEFEEFIKKG